MGKVLNFELILKRNLHNTGLLDESQDDDADSAASEIRKLTHIRLDREEICEIDNLESLGNVTNLYLQGNCITKIENLECLAPTLRFLTLADNKITHVEGLSLLGKLGFLDMCDNQIDSFDADQLPKGLVFIALDGNECCEKADYKDKLIASLPRLRSIDGEMLAQDDSDISDSDDGDLDDTEYTPGTFNLRNMAADLLDRSVLRLDDLIAEHKERISELDDAAVHSSEANGSGEVPQPTGTLAELEERLKDALEEMLKAEKDGQEIFKSFDIAERPPPKSLTPAPLLSPISKTAKPPMKKEEKMKKVNLVSSGTTTSSPIRSSSAPKKLLLPPIVPPINKKNTSPFPSGRSTSASSSQKSARSNYH